MRVQSIIFRMMVAAPCLVPQCRSAGAQPPKAPTAESDPSAPAREHAVPSGVPKPSGSPSHEFKYVTHGGTFSVQLFPTVPLADGSVTLYAWPSFALKADEAGKLEVGVEPQAKGEKSAVRLTLLVNPAPLLNAAKAELALKGNVQVANVILRDLYVGDSRPGKAAFETLVIKGETHVSELPLVAYLAAEDAALFARGLRDGTITADFRVSARLYAERPKSDFSGVVHGVKLRDVEAATVLLGQGGATRTTASGNATTNDAAYVSRQQEEAIRAEIKNSVAVRLRVTGSPEHKDMLFALIDAYLERHVFAEETPIDITVDNVLKLNRYGFDLADLKPDVIRKTITDVKDFLEDQKRDTITIKAGGSFLGVTANAEFNKEDFVKHLKDLGWKIDQEGTKYVPRSMSVRAVNKQGIAAHTGFSVALDVNSYSDVKLETVINTATRIHPAEKLVNHPSELAALTRELLELHRELDLLEAEGRGVLIASVEARKSLEALKHEIRRQQELAKDMDRYPQVREFAAVMVGCLTDPWLQRASLADTNSQLALQSHMLKQNPCALKVQILEKKISALVGK